MLVLVTGCTLVQIGLQPRSNNTIQKIDVPSSIVEALRASGHEVDFRRVDPGEDLSRYDVAWVNLAPVNSLNGRQGATGALWTLGSGLPCVGFFDDWAFSLVFNGAQSIDRNPRALYKHLVTTGKHQVDVPRTHYSLEDAQAAIDAVKEAGNPLWEKLRIERYYPRDNDETTRKYEDQLLEQCRALKNERWSRGMVPVCPMYGWGDRSIVSKKIRKIAPDLSPIEALDPSSTIYPLIAKHEPFMSSRKLDEWVLGALAPHDGWVDKQAHEWPVHYVGAKTMVRKHGGDRLKTESEVIHRYNEAKGLLSPPYPHAGSGWWRSRFMYSARVRSVLVCDKGEAAALGPAYSHSMKDVESMDDEQYSQAALDQAEALRAFMPHPDVFKQHCNDILTRAKDEDKGWS